MTSSIPLVSVVVPVYNAEKYLPRCLDSLLAQTERNIEILAVNDGSSDGGLDVLRAYEKKDKRLRVFDGPNQGASCARNIGLKAARGRYLMFCDADDWVEPRWVEMLLAAVCRRGVDAAACDCFLEEEKGHGRSRASVEHHLLHHNGRMPLRAARWRVNHVLWNKIFDLHLVRQMDLFFPEGMEYDDDAFVYLYLSREGTFLFLKNRRLYHYTVRRSSIMGRISRHDYQGHEMDHLYSKKFVLEELLHRKLWEKEAEAFLAQLHFDLLVCFKALEKTQDRERLAALSVSLFGGLTVPEGARISPLVRAVLNRDSENILKWLRAPDLNIRMTKVAGLPLLRHVQSWCSEKIFFLGMQIYKKEPFYLGGRRFILGLPVTRRV